MLECADGSFYIGVSSNLPSRLQRHETGRGPRYTSTRLPLKLVYAFETVDLAQAMAKEKWLKRQTREMKLKVMAEWSEASPKRG
jgi:predicted GIY-YIG superfamily endonuclease